MSLSARHVGVTSCLALTLIACKDEKVDRPRDKPVATAAVMEGGAAPGGAAPPSITAAPEENPWPADDRWQVDFGRHGRSITITHIKNLHGRFEYDLETKTWTSRDDFLAEKPVSFHFESPDGRWDAEVFYQNEAIELHDLSRPGSIAKRLSFPDLLNEPCKVNPELPCITEHVFTRATWIDDDEFLITQSYFELPLGCTVYHVDKGLILPKSRPKQDVWREQCPGSIEHMAFVESGGGFMLHEEESEGKRVRSVFAYQPDHTWDTLDFPDIQGHVELMPGNDGAGVIWVRSDCPTLHQGKLCEQQEERAHGEHTIYTWSEEQGFVFKWGDVPAQVGFDARRNVFAWIQDGRLLIAMPGQRRGSPAFIDLPGDDKKPVSP